MTEDHPYTSRFHRLKTVFTGGHKLVVPESWVDGQTPKGNAWVGDGKGRYELQIVAGATAVGNGEEAMLEAISQCVRERLQAFGVSGQIGDSKLGRINDRVQMEVVTDDPRAPTARTYNWIRLLPNGNDLLEVGFHLIVLRELWDRSATQDLIDLFGEQIRNVVLEEPQTLAFDRLRSVHPFGFLTFQVPARWIDEWKADAGMWFCGEAGEEDTGSLWVDYRWQEGLVGPRVIEKLLAKMQGEEGRETRLLSEQRGISYRRFALTDSKDGLLYYHHWAIARQTSRGNMLVLLSLVLGPEQVDEPEYRTLIETMARQAELLLLDENLIPPGKSPVVASADWSETGGSGRHDRGPGLQPPSLNLDRLRRISPFGFLTLEVPARWRDERDAGSGEWFCGEDETDTGTLWIDYDVFRGSFDQRGPERLVQKLGDAVAWRPPGEGWRRVGYQSFTEDDGVKLRFHRWFVIDWTAERAVMATLTLVLQAAWDGEPEFDALVAIIERQAAALAIGVLPG